MECLERDAARKSIRLDALIVVSRRQAYAAGAASEVSSLAQRSMTQFWLKLLMFEQSDGSRSNGLADYINEPLSLFDGIGFPQKD